MMRCIQCQSMDMGGTMPDAVVSNPDALRSYEVEISARYWDAKKICVCGYENATQGEQDSKVKRG